MAPCGVTARGAADWRIGIWTCCVALTPPASPAVARFEIVPSEDASATTAPGGHNVTFSPDGSTIVYHVRRGQSSQLYLRRLGEMEARPIAGTDGAVYPFFSPDSRRIGFMVDSQIKWLPISGGAATLVCRVHEGANPSWGPDENIYFSHLGPNPANTRCS